MYCEIITLNVFDDYFPILDLDYTEKNIIKLGGSKL